MTTQYGDRPMYIGGEFVVVARHHAAVDATLTLPGLQVPDEDLAHQVLRNQVFSLRMKADAVDVSLVSRKLMH